MDVRVHKVGYMVDQRPKSLIALAVQSLYPSSSLNLSDEEALLLNEVSMQLKQGGVNVFMGLGIGHKCLIECIALRQREGLMSGKIYYDGVIRKNGIFKDIVLIHDLGVTHFNSLSVFDYLYHGARLRVSHGIIECRERARQAARVVYLEGTKRIGTLSKPELRLLDIAAELVSNPTLICLLDPTEGLDASGKVEVMRVLKNIASRVSMPTTVLYNVSSIENDTIEYVDQLALFSGRALAHVTLVQRFKELSLIGIVNLLAKASLVILDSTPTTADSFPYITSSAIHHTAFMKVIDEMARLESLSLQPTSTLPLSSSERRTQFFTANRRTGEAGLPVRYRKSLLKEFSILALRSLKFHYNNGIYVRVIIVRFTLICVLIGSLAYHDGDALIDAPDLTTGSHNFAYKPATNATSVCFVLVAMSLVGVAFTVPHLHANIRLMKFEVNSGLQGVVSSWLSLILIDLPIYILVALVISLIMYSMVDIESSLNTYLGTTLMVLLTGYSVALNCAIWCASLPLATFVFSLISSFFLLFCGYLQVIDNLSPLWYWVSNVVFTRYAFQAYMVATFTKADDGDAFLAIYNFENTSAKSCNGWMLMWLFGLQILVVIGLIPPFSRMQLLGKLADVAVKSHEDYATFDSSQSKPTIAAKESEREENKGNIRSAHESIISVAARTEKSGSSGKSFRSTLALEKPQDMLNIERSLTSYGLTLSDNEAKIIFVPKNMITTLSFHGIRYVQDIGTNDSAFSEPVLNGVSGTISPGNCVCILDGQEDRSSLILLQILAGRGQATGKISGVIAANKHRIGKHQGYVNAAYVQHGDAPCMAPLTVRETLTYAALLRRTDQYNTITRLMARSPEDYVNEFELLGRSGDVENRVAEVISMLGLDHIADCMIGQVAEHRERRTHLDKSLSVARHLSSYRHRLYSALCKASATSITPAQLRLVSIGMELVNRPGLIFLEDPFLGLEWQDAERVAVVLRSLAEGNRTVICNISKPVTRIVSYFHEMFLLGSGLCLYSGPVSNVAEHFENVGYARGDMSMVEYVLDIAGDRGRLASTSGKRGARLSPADLADLNRSLVNIKSGQSPEHLEEENSMATESELDRGSLAGRSGEDREISSAKDSISTNNPIRITSIASNASNSTSDSRSKKLLPDYAFDESMYISPKNTTLSSRSNKQKNMTVTMNIRDVPVGPTARILLRRGLKLLLSDRAYITFYLAKCLVIGIILGSVYYNIPDGDVQARLSLFSVMYLAMSLQVADSIPAVYKRKELFEREAFVNASNYIAYYLMDSTPILLLLAVGTLITVAVVYMLAQLRGGVDHFAYLYLLLYVSCYCNYTLAYALSSYVTSVTICRLVFAGVVMPLQFVMGGYMILTTTMQNWSFWGSYINPMTYFLSGAIRNECSTNPHCLESDTTTYRYQDIQDQYGYHMDLYRCVIVICVLGMVQKCVWFCMLRVYELSRRRAVRRGVMAITKRARGLLQASYRLSERMSNFTSSTVNKLEAEALAELEM